MKKRPSIAVLQLVGSVAGELQFDPSVLTKGRV
jgi:hypothetical protein